MNVRINLFIVSAVINQNMTYLVDIKSCCVFLEVWRKVYILQAFFPEHSCEFI